MDSPFKIHWSITQNEIPHPLKWMENLSCPVGCQEFLLRVGKLRTCARCWQDKGPIFGHCLCYVFLPILLTLHQNTWESFTHLPIMNWKRKIAQIPQLMNRSKAGSVCLGAAPTYRVCLGQGVRHILQRQGTGMQPPWEKQQDKGHQSFQD